MRVVVKFKDDVLLDSSIGLIKPCIGSVMSDTRTGKQIEALGMLISSKLCEVMENYIEQGITFDISIEKITDH